MHGESIALIFSTARGHQRSPKVTKGQKSEIFKIGQMTYQIEENCTWNRMQPFLAPPEVTQGYQRSPKVTKRQKQKIFKIGQMTYQIEANCTWNRMQPFLAPPEVTRGHQRSKNENFQARSNEANCTGNRKIGRSQVVPNNRTAEARPLKLNDRRSVPKN